MVRHEPWRTYAARSALAGAVVSVLLLTGLLVPGTSQGNSAFNVAGVSTLSVHFRGACLPGQLDGSSSITAGETISDSNQKVIGLTNNGDVFGCLGVDDDPNTPQEDGPDIVIIDSELFEYANVAAETTAAITISQNNFDLGVQNLTTDLNNPTGQSDWPNRFPASGFVYVRQELMQYSSRAANSLHIIARGVTRPGGPATVAAPHGVGEFVRAQGRLKLVERRQPTYNDGFVDDLGGATTNAAHSVGATVQSPQTYLTCRNRMDQTVQSGPDPVTSRSRCYTRLEPDGAWPDPYTGPLLALANLFFHNISVGTIDDGVASPTTTTNLVTKIFGFSCFTFVVDELWVKVTSTTTIDKNTTNKSLGEFRASLYTNDTCVPPAVSIIGGTDGLNSSTTPLVNQNADTDGDGCTDFQELGANVGTGGLRDPYNAYDFYDANKDGSVTTVDIFAVAAKFGETGPPFSAPTANYSANHDRGGLLPDGDGIDSLDSALDGPGPNAWNQKAPDGAIAIPDIFATAAQFGHAC